MKVHLIDDDVSYCFSLSALLEEDGFDAKTYHSGNEFAPKSVNTEKDCVLLDLNIPGTDTMDLLQNIVHSETPVPVIMMSGVGDIPVAVKALQLGARDFVVKPMELVEISKRIRDAIAEPKRGQTIPPRELEDFRMRLNQLTVQENRVIKLMTTGLLNKEIAFELNLSVRTVENYRANAMAKLMLPNTAALFKYYFQN